MRIGNVIILLIIIFLPNNIYAYSSYSDSSAVEYHEDGFGLLCFLADSEQFFVEWAKPDLPIISYTSTVNRGDSLFPIILYSTDATDKNGNAFITYDITIHRPDGSVYGDYSDLIVCKDMPAGSFHFYLMAQPILITIEDTDPFGIYTVNLVVYEKNKNVTIPLNLSFGVVEKNVLNSGIDTLTNIDCGEELDLFGGDYYISPRPDLITEALLFISDSVISINENAIHPMYGFFSVIFSQNKDSIHQWKNLAEKHVNLKEFIDSTIKASKNPKEDFMTEPISASLNDIYWGAFFASGDIYYIKEISKHLIYIDDQKDMMLYLAGATAAWSLSSNARIHPKVKEYLLLIKDESDPRTSHQIDSLLSKDPEEIKQQMIDFVKMQREKHVWQ